MRNKYQRLTIILILFVTFTITATAAQLQILPQDNLINICNDVFDGYSGTEVTDHGLLGYNYAITTPNNEEILFGFDP